MGVQTLLMLVGDVAPTSWPPYVTVAASLVNHSRRVDFPQKHSSQQNYRSEP